MVVNLTALDVPDAHPDVKMGVILVVQVLVETIVTPHVLVAPILVPRDVHLLVI